jgi:hypothetical protein
MSQSAEGAFYRTFWGYDSSATKTIAQRPNAWLQPKNAKQARDLWKKSGNLLVVERAWLSTYTVLATYLSEPVLSNVWWPIKVEDEIGKALAVWLNSTFGLLLLLSMAVVTRGPWVDFKKEYLQEMPVLNIQRLGSKAKVAFLELFQKQAGAKMICELKFNAIPEEFANLHARKVIDDEICKILGLNFKLDALYMLLSKEPMLTS